MKADKKVVAKLKVSTELNKYTLLVFAHASGLITYHLMGEISMSNRSLDELAVKKPLPCVHFDYATVKNLVNAVVDSIESSTVVRTIARKEYEDG